jgi:replicative DNA helicase
VTDNPDIFPGNIGAERSILGAILLEEKAYDEAAALGLDAYHFSLDSHRIIFGAIQILAQHSSAIDIVTLSSYLRDHKQLAKVGDIGYVSGLLDGVPDRPSIKHYVRIVVEKAAQRALILACGAATEGLQQEMNSGDAIEYLTDKMLQVQTGSDEAPARRLIEFSEATYSEWEKLAQGTSDLIGLSTGVDSLDLATTGIRQTEFWVYAGRTGDGKTNLVLQTIARSCQEDIPVAIFSLEMPKETLLQRLWAGEGRVDFNHIRYPRRLNTETKMKIEQAMCEVAKWPLFVVEESGIQLSKLIAKAKLLIRRERVRLIAVDYVQLVSTYGRDERERLTKISHGLMALAKDTGVPVIGISQLTRPKDGNENQRPAIFNLKESGSLENDAHVIVMIYRPVDERKMKTGEDELIVGKQRGGMTSIEKVAFMPWLRFHERIDQ